ncbi:MAG: helix-hairpin-helix domain-containing protein [Defluviitaleaceae bacterium]|nr:helix-hairpin-helix domain-containing protein [Defluviitaleaceae bacterium]
MNKLMAKFNIKSPVLFKVIMGGILALVAVLGIVYVNMQRDAVALTIYADVQTRVYLPNDYAPAPVIVVYVSGHVYYPGVFEFYEGARIWQAIEAAGGMTEAANPNAINLAGTLRDAQHIIVVGRDEVAAQETASAADGRININTATAAQLTTLSGIGDARATDIIRHRESRGGFNNIEEIMNVPGIGEGIFERIRENIFVD